MTGEGGACKSRDLCVEDTEGGGGLRELGGAKRRRRRRRANTEVLRHLRLQARSQPLGCERLGP